MSNLRSEEESQNSTDSAAGSPSEEAALQRLERRGAAGATTESHSRCCHKKLDLEQALDTPTAQSAKDEAREGERTFGV